MPKVVLLCRVDGNFGGVERCILTLAQGLNRKQFHPVIVGICTQGELLLQARGKGIDTEFLPMTGRLGVLRTAGELIQIAKTRNASLLHTFGLRSNAIGWRMQNKHKIPWIVRLPNINTTDYANPVRGILSHWANNYLIRRADALQVISPQLEEYIRSWRKPPKSIYTIFNGADTQFYNRDRCKENSQQFRSTDESTFWIGSVGRLDAIKGYDILLRVLAAIIKTKPNTHLMLVGGGPERENLEILARELQIETNVHFEGFHEDVRPYLKAFDLYVCSSHSEGVPNAMLEAMSMALPVVSTRAGGIESIIEDGRSGLLVPPNNEAALLEAIDRLIMDQILLFQMGKSARKRIEDSFSMEQMIENTQTMYTETINRVSK